MEGKRFTAAGPGYYEVKDHLFDQYEYPSYDDRTGPDWDTLIRGFQRILDEGEGISPIRRKAALFSYMLETARIDVDPRDWFADHFDHGNHVFNRLQETRRRECGNGPLAADAEHSGGRGPAPSARSWTLGHISLMAFSAPGGIPGSSPVRRACRREGRKAAEFYECAVRVYEAALRYTARLEEQARLMGREHPSAADRMEKLAGRLSALGRERPPRCTRRRISLHLPPAHRVRGSASAPWEALSGITAASMRPTYAGRITEKTRGADPVFLDEVLRRHPGQRQREEFLFRRTGGGYRGRRSSFLPCHGAFPRAQP